MASLAAPPDLKVAVRDSSVKVVWLSADTHMTTVSITYKKTHHIPPSFRKEIGKIDTFVSHFSCHSCAELIAEIKWRGPGQFKIVYSMSQHFYVSSVGVLIVVSNIHLRWSPKTLCIKSKGFGGIFTQVAHAIQRNVIDLKVIGWKIHI